MSKLPKVSQLENGRTHMPAPVAASQMLAVTVSTLTLQHQPAKLTWSSDCNSFIFSRFGKRICVDRLLSFWRYLWIFITWIQRYRTNEKISINSCLLEMSWAYSCDRLCQGGGRNGTQGAQQLTASLKFSSYAWTRQKFCFLYRSYIKNLKTPFHNFCYKHVVITRMIKST